MSARQGVPQTAALRLLAAGVTGAQLARELDVTPQAISFQLAGKAAETSADLLAAIEHLTDEKTAREVALLIEAARHQRRAS